MSRQGVAEARGLMALLPAAACSFPFLLYGEAIARPVLLGCPGD